MYYPHVKRLIDICGAMTGIILLGIPMLVVAIVIKAQMGGQVIFRQARAGKDQQDFVIYKFRTMSDEIGVDGELLPGSLRITKFGRFLRKTSLDELPQFFNVLKGEMSLVGPRPLLSSYIPFYSERELKRFRVLPGISGLAQIEGRHNAGWDERLGNDVFYVENLSFLLDLKIILCTVVCVLKQSDVVVAPAEAVAHLDVARSNDLADAGSNVIVLARRRA